MDTYSRIQQARIAMLRSLIADETVKSFAGRYNIDPSYVSQVLTGHRSLGDKAALTLEAAIGLPELSLFCPASLEARAETETLPEQSIDIEHSARWERLENAINGLLGSTPANLTKASAELAAARDAYRPFAGASSNACLSQKRNNAWLQNH